MRKSTIWVLVAIMALTFAGFLYLQISYLNNIIQMRKEQFALAVKRTLYDVSEALERDESIRYLQDGLNETQKRLISYEFNSSLNKNIKPDSTKLNIPSSDKLFNNNQTTSIVQNSVTKTYMGMQEMLKKQYLYQKGLLNDVVLKILNTASLQPILERVDTRQL